MFHIKQTAFCKQTRSTTESNVHTKVNLSENAVAMLCFTNINK